MGREEEIRVREKFPVMVWSGEGREGDAGRQG